MATIELKGGLFIEEAAIRLALALENAGVTLKAADGILTASPRSALTAEQIAAIRQWKQHLLALAVYDADAS